MGPREMQALSDASFVRHMKSIGVIWCFSDIC